MRFGLALSLILAAPPVLAGNPWEELMGRKPQMWSDPEGRFAVDLPQGWKATSKNRAPNIVEFFKTESEHGLTAKVSMEIRTVPKGVKLAHFVQRVNEESNRAVRELRIVETDQLEVSGTQARRQLVTYQLFGHTELRAEAVQVIMVGEERAYVFTLETPFGARGLFWEDFEIMVKGLSLSGTGAPAMRTSPDAPRKKLRAGEMVNPDELKY
ncbi:MAG: hypothetical protein HYV07_04130 [Deltaproteobacteria bacterium]|nr:hypothetical protein [Deltaproteobacteria bacterium]